ncbi:MAG: hypothetical protein ABR953_11830 [Candidatus Acidiferrales bacterium]|jgi:hypothetical protein
MQAPGGSPVAGTIWGKDAEKLSYPKKNLPVILASVSHRSPVAVTNFGHQTKARVYMAFALH